jgi:VWFA-related protein
METIAMKFASASLAVLLCVGGGLRGVGQAQQAPPVFRAGTDVVEVIAHATDRRGAPARGLTRDDFIVVEDGVVQTITQFSFVEVPRLGSSPQKGAPTVPAAPGALGNAAVPASTDRSYVLLLDARHVDPLRSGNVRRQAKRFIEKYVEPGDTAAVLTIAGTTHQGFTSDKAQLAKVIDTFVGGKARSAALNRLESQIRSSGDGAPRDYENAVKAADAKALFDALRQLCVQLGELQGRRRAVILFSEGIELDLTDMIGPGPSNGGAEALASGLPSTYAMDVLLAEREMLEAARRSNVALYTVDPRGTSVGEDALMEATGQPASSGRGVPMPPTPPPTRDVAREVQRSQGVLRLLAQETGGLAIVNTSDFDRGFGRIVDANSVYYVVGYSSTN